MVRQRRSVAHDSTFPGGPCWRAVLSARQHGRGIGAELARDVIEKRLPLVVVVR
jgi:hypothetical protein